MRHLKRTCKLSRTSSHKRCMFANMVKSLIIHERIETTVAKAKELRRYADKMITIAKKDTIASRRLVRGRLMIRYNKLTSKEARRAKNGDLSVYNDDRKILNKLFGPLKEKYLNRNGGYTRIIKKDVRIGDSAPKCYIEYID